MVDPAALMRNGRQTTTVTDGVHVTGVKGPLQMLRDLFEVFTYCQQQSDAQNGVDQLASSYVL